MSALTSQPLSRQKPKNVSPLIWHGPCLDFGNEILPDPIDLSVPLVKSEFAGPVSPMLTLPQFEQTLNSNSLFSASLNFQPSAPVPHMSPELPPARPVADTMPVTDLDSSRELSLNESKTRTDKKSRKRKQRAPQATRGNKKLVTEADLLEEKRKQRLVRNRASAQLSRDRKKLHLQNLERSVKTLTEENARLHAKVEELTEEVTRLRKQATEPKILDMDLHDSLTSSPFNGTYHSPSSDYLSGGSSPFTSSSGHSSPVRSGLFLFAFVFCFGLLFQWTGLDMGKTTLSVQPAPLHGSGRALTSYSEPPAIDWSRAAITPHPLKTVADVSSDHNRQVAQAVKAITRYDDAAKSDKSPPVDLSVSQYTANQDRSLDSFDFLSALYDKMMWANESINSDASYFFVPSVFSMFDHGADTEEAESTYTGTKAKVAGYLPDPNRTSHFSHNGSFSSQSHKLSDVIQEGDRLYFWMPPATDYLEDMTRDREAYKQYSAPETMFEIGCHVGTVRRLPFSVFSDSSEPPVP